MRDWLSVGAFHAVPVLQSAARCLYLGSPTRFVQGSRPLTEQKLRPWPLQQ